ncbi:hypothetical protein LQF12_03510 [Ruania suaedae]|uniref:VOC family protein n=1 Tax=Ruania suaedae TaxID=2897774 RepID=UPI001E525B3E|nr:VOC family protein [Ruania suaedae]UFU03686.1 hypothetical protein LQF12_03510 [Ruania suaedae]
MALTLDAVSITAADPARALDGYTSTFAPSLTDGGEVAVLDLHGRGRLELDQTPGTAPSPGTVPSGFDGYVLTYLVEQPSDVRAVMQAAAGAGAQELKPAKKALFGSFSGVFRAIDGSVWKVAAGTRKDSDPAASTPRPTETTLILGVGEPTTSRAFYEALGLVPDRDYGSKYIDFAPLPGATRLCLMQHPVLAKDVGVGPQGSAGTEGRSGSALTLRHRAATPAAVDALLDSAAAAGGAVTTPGDATDHGYRGVFTDPDGFRWLVST